MEERRRPTGRLHQLHDRRVIEQSRVAPPDPEDSSGVSSSTLPASTRRGRPPSRRCASSSTSMPLSRLRSPTNTIGPSGWGAASSRTKVVGNEVGDDLIGTPSGQPRADRDDRADRDERVHVSGAGAAAEGVRQRDTGTDHRPVPRRRTAEAGDRRRPRTDLITTHQSLGGADVAVVVLGQHHGYAGAAGRAEGRADAPVVSMQYVEPAGSEQSPDRAPKSRVHDRHRMRPCRVAVEPGQTLGRRPDAVDGDGPVECRSCRTVRGDRDHLDAMAAFRQCMRQVPDVLLLTAGHRGVELGHHQHSHAGTEPRSLGRLRLLSCFHRARESASSQSRIVVRRAL